jgi:hypothetical protein
MPADDHDRQRRLAEALRANLRRRKGQVRERKPADQPVPENSDRDS